MKRGHAWQSHSENRSEGDEVARPLAAKTDVDPEEHVLERVESEPDAVRGVEVSQVDVLPVRANLARVEEQRHVESRERLPSVLGIEHQSVLVVEAEVAIRAQRI